MRLLQPTLECTMDCFNLRVSRLDDAALAQHDAALLQAACTDGGRGGTNGPGAHPPAASQAAEPAETEGAAMRSARMYRRFNSGPSRAAASVAVAAGGAAPVIGFGGLPLPVRFCKLSAETSGHHIPPTERL